MFDLEKFVKTCSKSPQPLNYKKWLQVTVDITTHTMGIVPAKLRTRRPGEPEDVFEYRKSILQNVTKGNMGRAFDNLYRIFQSTSWTFVSSKGLLQWLTEETFEHNFTFKSYAEKILLRYAIEDPNAILTWMPMLDESEEMINVKPVIFPSRKIRYVSDDVVMILNESAEKCSEELQTLDPKKTYNIGSEYILLTKSGIYKLNLQRGNKTTIT